MPYQKLVNSLETQTNIYSLIICVHDALGDGTTPVAVHKKIQVRFWKGRD